MNEDNNYPIKIYNQIWANIDNGISDRNHEYHSGIFSSIDNKKFPSLRSIILRNASKSKRTITFHTDYRSQKIEQISKNNNCFLLLYSAKLKEQLRIKVKSEINHKNELTRKIWDNISLMSKKCYLTKFPPSTNVEIPTDGIDENLIGKEPSEKDSLIGFINFSVIVNYIESIEWLFLNSNGHRRIIFDFREDIIKHQWLIP